MNDTLSLEHNLAEFNRRLAAWNAELTADIDLYDFMELALNTLEAFHWVKSSVAAGAPLKVSSDPNEAIFEFADHFFERWRKVHFSILISGRNSKDEVLEAITPFVIKLCEVYGNAERIMELYSPSQIHRDEVETLKNRFPGLHDFIYGWLIKPSMVRTEYQYRILVEDCPMSVVNYFRSICSDKQMVLLDTAIQKANERNKSKMNN